jgi:hypothetical protein
VDLRSVFRLRRRFRQLALLHDPSIQLLHGSRYHLISGHIRHFGEKSNLDACLKLEAVDVDGAIHADDGSIIGDDGN